MLSSRNAVDRGDRFHVVVVEAVAGVDLQTQQQAPCAAGGCARRSIGPAPPAVPRIRIVSGMDLHDRRARRPMSCLDLRRVGVDEQRHAHPSPS